MVTNMLLRLDKADDNSTIRDNLSAVALVGRFAWLGTDEGTCLERLEINGDHYGDHHRVDLGDLVGLPSDPDEEVDVEGLCWADDVLWVIGSHAAKRSKPKRTEDPMEAANTDSADEVLRKLAKLKSEGNRFLLARLPLRDGGREAGKGALLAGNEKRNELIDALRQDRHLRGSLPRAFVEVDGKETLVGSGSKEGGLDIEGLAAVGNRLFIGCRGPVLRGWAVILDVEVVESKPNELHLVEPLRKHFVYLDGLGIRDLVLDGHDLLILAGPTAELHGPARVYRYKGATSATEDTAASPEELFPIPHGERSDHAEGMDLIDLPASDTEPPGRGLLVVYDSPAKARREANGKGVMADIFRLP